MLKIRKNGHFIKWMKTRSCSIQILQKHIGYSLEYLKNYNQFIIKNGLYSNVTRIFVENVIFILRGFFENSCLKHFQKLKKNYCL